MITEGRTMHEARIAGTWYGLTGPDGWTYAPTQAETPAEVLEMALDHRRIKPGRYTIERVLGGSIGGFITEVVGEYDYDGSQFKEVPLPMIRYRVEVRRYPNEPMPFGVEVWDIMENERDERRERKFKNLMLAYAYAAKLRKEFNQEVI